MSENHNNQLLRIRHSASHIMAQAVLEIFPEGKFAIGPATDDGFYYDFDLPRPLTPEDLEKVEARMREIIQEGLPFIYQEVTVEQARTQFKDQPYKLELIDNLQAGSMDEDGNPTKEPVKISFYTHGQFTDLCRGPHVENTGQINPNAIKLLSTAGAYWRGSEKNPCCSAFTVQPLKLLKIWRNTSPGGRRLKSAITASLENSWIYSASIPIWAVA